MKNTVLKKGWALALIGLHTSALAETVTVKSEAFFTEAPQGYFGKTFFPDSQIGKYVIKKTQFSNNTYSFKICEANNRSKCTFIGDHEGVYPAQEIQNRLTHKTSNAIFGSSALAGVIGVHGAVGFLLGGSAYALSCLTITGVPTVIGSGVWMYSQFKFKKEMQNMLNATGEHRLSKPLGEQISVLEDFLSDVRSQNYPAVTLAKSKGNTNREMSQSKKATQNVQKSKAS